MLLRKEYFFYFYNSPIAINCQNEQVFFENELKTF